jgi:2-keto-4-pentenoate hydratase/2-oxohepta-3-ene-1,7-dioic acid hydratase in catechol pathway
MKLITYTYRKKQHVGAVVADDKLVINLAAAERKLARKKRRKPLAIFSDMLSLLEAGRKGMRAAKAAAKVAPKKADGKLTLRLKDVKLCAPVPNPRKVLCLAGNYMDHIQEGGQRIATTNTQTPRIFCKPPSTTTVAPGTAIRIPPIARSIDWEGELAVVIGRKAKGVSADDALKYVAGYTIMNDVSERDLQVWPRDDTQPRDKFFDWLSGKWLDTFGPLGPYLVTRDDVPDPQALEISTFVNGERKQNNTTAQMIFPVARIIEFISTYLTLEPGDIISTGTISGVGAASGTYLQPGDDVEIQITGLGSLRNPVKAAKK